MAACSFEHARLHKRHRLICKDEDESDNHVNRVMHIVAIQITGGWEWLSSKVSVWIPDECQVVGQGGEGRRGSTALPGGEGAGVLGGVLLLDDGVGEGAHSEGGRDEARLGVVVDRPHGHVEAGVAGSLVPVHRDREVAVGRSCTLLFVEVGDQVLVDGRLETAVELGLGALARLVKAVERACHPQVHRDLFGLDGLEPGQRCFGTDQHQKRSHDVAPVVRS